MDEDLKPLGVRVSEAAERLGCSESTVRRMLKSGELGGYRVRAAVRVDSEDLIRHVRVHRYLGIGGAEEAAILRRFFPWYRYEDSTPS